MAGQPPAPFNPEEYKFECMGEQSITLGGNKYFMTGVFTGVAGSALLPTVLPPRLNIIHVRASPFLLLGLAGICADFFATSAVCAAKTEKRLMEFMAAQGTVLRGGAAAGGGGAAGAGG
eukprot:SAG22_NODE_907_length_6555_cov_19.560099_7_plen_118_part_01